MICLKCGGEVIRIAYHAHSHECAWGSHAKEGKEHLHYTCSICGWDWTEKTKDTKEEQK